MAHITVGWDNDPQSTESTEFKETQYNKNGLKEMSNFNHTGILNLVCLCKAFHFNRTSGRSPQGGNDTCSRHKEKGTMIVFYVLFGQSIICVFGSNCSFMLRDFSFIFVSPTEILEHRQYCM